MELRILMTVFFQNLFLRGILGVFIIITPLLATPMQSVSRITFGAPDTLFVADWKDGSIHAFVLPTADTTKDEQYFNLRDLDSILAKTLKQSGIIIEDMVKRPESNEVYIAISYGAKKVPAIVMIKADGTAKVISTGKLKHSSVKLDKTPDGKLTFWNNIPHRSFTVTDMKWHKGELFIVGLSNQDFASTLRRIPYPFNGTSSLSSIEIYHAIHDQLETRAPIRAMAFAELGGKSYLIAAYTCTPLVTIPLDELKDGAHVRGKTIAELGYGNAPLSMISYSMGTEDKKESYVILINLNRDADLMSVSSIEEANNKDELSAPPANLTETVGLKTARAPLAGVLRIDNQNENLFIAVRRNIINGKAELVSIPKGMTLRLSDFVSEYNFPTYTFKEEKQLHYIKPFQDQLKRAEGYADLVSN